MLIDWNVYYMFVLVVAESVNVVMESKGGKKKSRSSNSLQYEVPLGYSIEDVRPNGGIEKFRSAAYSNVRFKPCAYIFNSLTSLSFSFIFILLSLIWQCVRKPS